MLLESSNLVFQILNSLLEFVALQLQELDMVVRLSQLPLEVLTLLLGVVQLHHLGVHILCGQIGDQGGSCCIV